MKSSALTKTGHPFWQNFYGPNQGYILELYERYLQNPDDVDPSTRMLFATYGNPAVALSPPPAPGSVGTSAGAVAGQVVQAQCDRMLAAFELARNIRNHGHLAADIDPIHVPHHVAMLDPATYHLSPSELATMPAQTIWPNAPMSVRTGKEAIDILNAIYCGDLAYEFSQVKDTEERRWLYRTVEAEEFHHPLARDERLNLLHRLSEVESFEKFLHRTFAGQKRFSIEGLDVMVPMLDAVIEFSVTAGTRNVMIGMAHRGRLNVLAHILRKPYEQIFAEFHGSPNRDLVPSEGSKGINYGWSGDVKYHLGASRLVQEGTEIEAHLTLANNPSHLEFVNPVVEGFARAAQDDRSQGGAAAQHVEQAVAIQIHGDAAFPGEGVVAETLNLSGLRAYQTGGTIHIIANNHLGFTAEGDEGRSTRYASDLAKGFEIPVVHVSADHPEACLRAARLAHQYRERYHKDFVIDLIGYRRWGHNEGDDPTPTQPLLYKKISSHPPVRALYADLLQKEGIVSAQDVQAMEDTTLRNLRAAYEKVDQVHEEDPFANWIDEDTSPNQTPLSDLTAMNEALLRVPAGFTVYPKLMRILERRRDALAAGGKVDWAQAEALAFASILADGTPIRLTGQDSERGTFGHRHLVLHDMNTNHEHVPLQALPQAKASFCVYNSALSEAAVLGFEYGYSIQAPQALVMWEAQFGDFANTAQVLIDQFISAGISKWGQPSGLVLLLPHGYEGQGPEHSSARLERYLQLSAQNNWVVANVTTAAQYFHLLRQHAATLGKTAHPLVIMTPKSLLRNPKAMSPASELANGTFRTIIHDDSIADPAQVTRLILCSGKVSVDIDNAMDVNRADSRWLSMARIERLYPFPEQAVQRMIERFPALRELVWVQEEPQNMGAWTYMRPILQRISPQQVTLCYIGRPEKASPADGHASTHNAEQARIIHEALKQAQPVILG